MIRIIWPARSIRAVVSVKMANRYLFRNSSTTVITAEKLRAMAVPWPTPLWTRSYRQAPTFCPA